MNKKTALIILLLSTQIIKASPFEVAQNVFQEFKQVQELIKQVEEIIKQAEQQAEILNNLSGKNIYQMTSQELELLRWLPEGDEILDPQGTGAYATNFDEIYEQLELLDPYELVNVAEGNENAEMAPQAMSRKKHQDSTIANSAYAKTLMNQFADRVAVVSDYLTELNNADSLKSSVDVNARITAQAAINQIEINRTMAMILQQKAAESQVELTNKMYTQKFFTREEQ